MIDAFVQAMVYMDHIDSIYGKTMNLAHLRAFHAVAVEGSFTRAARALGLSQPTLSAQVKALEDAHGLRLFDRQGREVHPTELGRRLLEATGKLMSLEEEIDALLAGARDQAAGALKVGTDTPVHAMAILADLVRAHPHLTPSVSIGNADSVLADLKAYRIDAAVMADPPEEDLLARVLVAEERLVAFLPRDHALAGGVDIGLADLAQASIVIRERGSVTRTAFERALTEAGITPGAMMEVEGREAVREAVLAGLGLGVVFESEFDAGTRLKALAIRDAGPTVAEYAVCLAHRRRLAGLRAFLDAARRRANTLAKMRLSQA